MKDELILHIGAHKTGTTTIQHALDVYGEALAAQGVSHVATGVYPNLHSVLGHVDADRIDFAPGGFGIKDPDTLFSAMELVPHERVIASSENFSYFIDPEQIEALAAGLRARFKRVRILTYLRRQDSQVVSHHQEGAKVMRWAEEMIYGYETSAIPKHAPQMDLYLDYNCRIGRWIDVFGLENVTVRVFDRARLAGGDIWQDFLAAAGIDGTGMAAADERNASHGLTRSKVGHMMNQRGLPEGLRREVLERLPADARQLPARAEAEAFYARYRESNIALNRRLGASDGSDLFSDDFSAYPEAAVEDWTEAQANRAISVLLDVLARLDTNLNPDLLRDAALIAEDAGRLDLALALMRGAARQRPHGPLIQSKLAEYAAALAEAEAGTSDPEEPTDTGAPQPPEDA